MAKNEQVRVHADVLQADQEGYLALTVLRDYRPVNPDFSQEMLRAAYSALQTAQEVELHAQNALAAARDATTSAQWEFHNRMLGAKRQVLAQYGPDSDQLAALGMKKKSERRRPNRSDTPTN